MRKCKQCSAHIPCKIKIDGKQHNISRRHYCLDCNPFGQRTKCSTVKFSKYKDCTVCGKEKSYKGGLCRACASQRRRFKSKQKAIALLGGKCIRCGWNKHLAGLEFHHCNDNKEFTIGKIMNRKWEVIKAEVLKCELLCSCCHRIHHCKYSSTGTQVA